MMEASGAFVDAIARQSEYLATLSLSVLGGGILCILWLVQRRIANQATIPLRWAWLVPLSVIFASVAIALYYLAYGSLINLIPRIVSTSASTPDQFFESLPSGFQSMQCLMISQFLAFFLAVLSLLLFALANKRLMDEAIH